MPSQRAIDRLLFPHGKFRSEVLLALVRQHWFVQLRWMFAALSLVVLTIERVQANAFRSRWPVAGAILALAVCNVLWTVVGRRLLRGGAQAADHAVLMRRVTWFVNAQMVADLLILTAILRYSGGIENPMAMFYLFHVLLAALLLRPLNALLQGLWGVALYSALTIGESQGWIAPHIPFLGSTAASRAYTDVVYVAVGIGVLGAAIIGTLYFTLQVSARLDAQEEELQGSNAALQEAQRAMERLQARRSRFMQTAAHQLKSPLATIEMLAELLHDKAVTREQADDIVRRIVARCQVGMEMVVELIRLARIEGAPTPRAQENLASVTQTARRIIERFADNAHAKKLSISFAGSDRDDDFVVMDERDLEDCVGNLVDNAIKYTQPGGDVHVQITTDEKEISVSVKDTGMGIAEKHLGEIFEPFCRGPQAIAAGMPGTGLGLTIVREVVERAGGRIAVTSKVNEGSVFTVYLLRAVSKKPPGCQPTAVARETAREGALATGVA